MANEAIKAFTTLTLLAPGEQVPLLSD